MYSFDSICPIFFFSFGRILPMKITCSHSNTHSRSTEAAAKVVRSWVWDLSIAARFEYTCSCIAAAADVFFPSFFKGCNHVIVCPSGQKMHNRSTQSNQQFYDWFVMQSLWEADMKLCTLDRLRKRPWWEWWLSCVAWGGKNNISVFCFSSFQWWKTSLGVLKWPKKGTESSANTKMFLLG